MSCYSGEKEVLPFIVANINPSCDVSHLRQVYSWSLEDAGLTFTLPQWPFSGNNCHGNSPVLFYLPFLATYMKRWQRAHRQDNIFMQPTKLVLSSQQTFIADYPKLEGRWGWDSIPVQSPASWDPYCRCWHRMLESLFTAATNKKKRGRI